MRSVAAASPTGGRVTGVARTASTVWYAARTGAGSELMPKTIANATVDRLLHHAHLVPTDGNSVRLAEALAGKGVMPLT